MNTNNPIELAVMPLKADAIMWAGKAARNTVEKVTAELIAADYDANKVAPYPRVGGGIPYEMGVAHYQLVRMLTKWRESTNRPGQPCYVDISETKVASFIKDTEESAAASYDAFVEKLVHKIGTVDTATLEGNHVWGYSYLTVTKGEVSEIWHTRQISNFSKFGKLFAQWPTRKVKKKQL